MKKKKILQKILIILACLVIICGAGFGIYVGTYSHAGDYAIACIDEPEKNVTVDTSTEGRIVFYQEKNIKAGLIFYPGGKVEYKAYAPLMTSLAKQGILCVLVKVPCNLAFFDVNAADGIAEEYPDISQWYVGGHSLGGVAASMYAYDHQDELAGMIFLASYTTKDFSDSSLKAISIYGSNDGVLNMDSYENNLPNMPADFTEYIIEGGNHGQFGDYGDQKGDNPADITAAEQWEETAALISGCIEEDYAGMDWDSILQLTAPDEIGVSLDDIKEEEFSPYEGLNFSILGDSYSAVTPGYWWSDEEYRWWSVVAKRLKMNLDTNASTFGIALNELTDEPDDLGNPDVIFILLGANDYAKGSTITFKENYRDLIHRVEGNYPDAEIVLVTYPYYMRNGRYEGAVEYVNPIIRELADEEDVKLADTEAESYDNIIDGVHTDPEGSYYLGNAVTESILRRTVGVTQEEADASQEAYYWKRVMKFRKQNEERDPGCVLFVGDSIVDFLDRKVYYPDLFAAQQGIAGDTTARLLWRMTTVYDAEPSVIILHIGANDIMVDDRSTEKIMENYDRIFAGIKENLPGAKVIVESIYPGRDGTYYQWADKQDRVVEVNSLLEPLAEEYGFTYADIYQYLVDDDGLIRADLCEDGIHINAEGYEIVSSILRPMIS